MAESSPEPLSAAARGLARLYANNDVRFTLPTGWEDRSVIIVTAPVVPPPSADGNEVGGEDGVEQAPSAGAPEFTVTLHRDTRQPDESLDAYAARQLDGLRAAVPAFELLREGAREVGGRPARDAEYRWMGDEGLIRQHQVHVLHNGRVLTWTATARAARYASYVAQFAGILASVRLVAPTLLVPGLREEPNAARSTDGAA